jgi:cell division protein FtsQ
MVIKKYSKAFFFSTAILLAGLHLGKWVGNDAGFLVQTVKVVGCKVLTREEVLTIAKVPLFKSIFKVELPAIEKRVEALPLVRQAQVSRIFPSTIVIAIQERKPLALISNAGLHPVDEEGIILPPLQAARHTRAPAVYDVPVLSGNAILKTKEGGQLAPHGRQAIDFLASLRSTNAMLYHSVSELSINSQGALTLYMMEGGVPVYMGSGKWLEKCDRLFVFLRHVQPASAKLLAIDLRYDNQIVIKES